MKRLSDIEQKVLKWIRSVCHMRAVMPHKIVLAHVANNGRFNDLDEVTIEEKPDETSMIAWARQFESAATQDAEGLGGMQKYMMQAFVMENESTEKVVSRLPFRMKIDNDETDEEDYMSEPSTPKGLVAQAQRHAEGYAKITMGAMTQIISTMQRANARQSEQIEKMLSSRMETYELLEELLTKKHERDLEAKDQELIHGIKKDAYDKLAGLAPVVANKIIGKKVFPETISPREQILHNLVKTMNQDQIEALRNTLGPEQLIMLGELMLDEKVEDVEVIDSPHNQNGEHKS